MGFMDEEIKEYIKNAIFKGVSKEEVIEILKEAGWDENRIKGILSELEKESPLSSQVTQEKIEAPPIEVGFSENGSYIGKEAVEKKSEIPGVFQRKEGYAPAQSFLPPQSQFVPSPQTSFQPPLSERKELFPSTPQQPFPSSGSVVAIFDDQGNKYCSFCGTRLKENAVYCPNCGRSIIEIGEPKIKKKDRKIFAIISFIFSIFELVGVLIFTVFYKFFEKKISYNQFLILFWVLCGILFIAVIFGILGRNSSKRFLAEFSMALILFSLILFLFYPTKISTKIFTNIFKNF